MITISDLFIFLFSYLAAFSQLAVSHYVSFIFLKEQITIIIRRIVFEPHHTNVPQKDTVHPGT